MQLLSCAVLAVLATAVYGASLPFGIILDDGKLGVNFFGFNAAVGIGGRNNGDGTGGGLHVEAGTPFGQRAAAGLGGNVGERTGGGLYAGATAGGGVQASAGLNGDLANGFSRGSLFSRASAGPVGVEKSIDKSYDGQTTRVGETVEGEDVDLRKNVISKSKLKASRHSEKMASKEVATRFNNDEDKNADKEIGVIEVRKYKRRGYSDADRGIGYGTGYMNAFLSPQYDRHMRRDVEDDQDKDKTYRSTGTFQVQKTVSPQHRSAFFEDIFNIPISTLGAVSRFLSNSAGAKSAGGTLDVSKTVSYNHH